MTRQTLTMARGEVWRDPLTERRWRVHYVTAGRTQADLVSVHGDGKRLRVGARETIGWERRLPVPPKE